MKVSLRTPGGAQRKWIAAAAFAAAMTLGACASDAPDTLRAANPNPLPTEHDGFGGSAAISGNLVVVGASDDSPYHVFHAGSAYVFNATTGALAATLNNPAPTADDNFGWSVAISGNLAVVGASTDSPYHVFQAGTAYIFNATTGALVSTLDNPAPAADDRFGYSVAISGNLAVVGAWWDDPGGAPNAGTAYVFNATTGALLATLNNPAPTAEDWFSYSVAISGDLAVVGENRDDPRGISDAGAAYVFNATTGALLATLNNPAPAQDDHFGKSAAIAGNLVVVGAEENTKGSTSMVFGMPLARGRRASPIIK